MPSKPLDLELHLSYDAPNGLYRVLARLAVQEITQTAEFRLDLNDATLASTLEWMKSGRGNEADVQAFGSELFQRLFSGHVHDLYTYARQNSASHLRIRLICNDMQVARIPWELMFDREQDSFLALDLLFIRDLALTAPRQTVATTPPLRVLVLQSSPKDLPAFSGVWEANDIGAALSELTKKQQVQVHFVAQATLAQLQNALREAVVASPPVPYQVVHFIGHGMIDPGTGMASLIFVDENGNSQIVTATEFATILKDQQVKLVFLNACASAQVTGFDTAQGLAPALMRADIPMFVGMQTAVDTHVAQFIAEAFYAALADGRSVDAALLDVRRLIRAATDFSHLALAIPVCYLHANDGVLMVQPSLTALATETPAVPIQSGLPALPLLKRVVAIVVALIGLVASVIAIWQAVAIWVAQQPPPPMSGSYNIAVAAIADPGMTPAGKGSADKLMKTFVLTLEQSLQPLRQEGFDIQVRGPDIVGAVKGATAAERALAAETLSLQHGADLLISGVLQFEPGKTTLQPEFYLAPQRLGNADEVSGYNTWEPLTIEDDITTNPSAAALFIVEFTHQAASWTEFAVGLGYTKVHHYLDAKSHLERALAVVSAAQPASSVQNKALYLLLGAVATKLADQSIDSTARKQALIDARAYYEQALDLDVKYARALLGLGQIEFLEGRGDCRPPDNADAVAMQKALARYGRARQFADAATLDEVPVKADLFEARLLQCWGSERADARLLDNASTRYQSIVDEYKKRTLPADRQRIRSYEAEAHAGLGLSSYITYVLNQTDGGALATALDEFRLAETASQELDRKAIVLLWQVRVLAHQNACKPAVETFTQAQQTEATYREENHRWKDTLYENLSSDIRKEVSDLCPNELLPTQVP